MRVDGPGALLLLRRVGRHVGGEVAELLGIPANVTQVALLPVAYTIGQDFKPAARPPMERLASWNRYGESAPPA